MDIASGISALGRFNVDQLVANVTSVHEHDNLRR